MRAKWRDRALFVAPYFTLCTSEKLYLDELGRLNIDRVDHPTHWLGGGNAATHTFDNSKGGPPMCLVTVDARVERTGVVLAGLLVHEAVHVWQKARDYCNEHRPSSELEAYSVQAISQELMWEYQRQVFGREYA